VYTFTYTTINSMPVGAGFQVQYPWTVEPAEVITTSLIWYKNVAYP